MNPIEKGQTFVKELNEINVGAVSKYFEIQREAVEQFVEANRTRFAALREVKGINDFVNAQREYYAAVQKNVTSSVEKQVELARTNFESTGKLVRGLFQSDTTASV